MRLVVATSAADKGRAVCDAYPALAGATDLSFTAPDAEAIGTQAKLAFLAVPHTAAIDVVPDLLVRGVTVIDLSADFRLKDAAVYERGTRSTTPLPSCSPRRSTACRSSTGRAPGRTARRVPRLLPDGVAARGRPRARGGHLHREPRGRRCEVRRLGRGRSPSPGDALLHRQRGLGSLQGRGASAHPGDRAGSRRAAGRDIAVTFTPHLVPMTRGLLATVYLRAATSR